MSLLDLEKKVNDLKTLPTTFYQVNQLIQSPTSSAADVGKVISQDQVMSVKLLKLVNSAFYGFPSKINNIPRAVTIIGFSGLRDLILSTSIMDVFVDEIAGSSFNRLEFWKHCLGTGLIAKIIAKYCKGLEVEELFVAGLLHDIGKVIIDQYLTSEFIQILTLTTQNYMFMYQAEKEILGYDHMAVGKLVAQKWKLPQPLLEAITYHHEMSPSQKFPKQTAIVHIANSIAQAIDAGQSGNTIVPLIDPNIWAISELNLSILESVVDETISEFADLERVFNQVR